MTVRSIESQETPIAVHISLEVVLYAVLAVITLALRLTQLATAPLDDAEAFRALATLRSVFPDVPGPALVSDSPLTALGHLVSFTFLGQSNFAARLPVALGGVLLTLAPALWRRYLNPLPPLILSLLLTLSPVALLASRTGSPVVWTMLLLIVGPWLVLRFRESGQASYAIAATVAFGGAIFLAEPAGLLVVAALAFGVLFAGLTAEDTSWRTELRELAQRWPWSNGLFAAGLVALVVTTGLFWLPSGLNALGELLWTLFSGFVERPAGTPVAFPLWVALRYEPGIMLFGLVASYQAVRVGSFFERVMAGWFLAGLVWAVGYAGADAAHALWLVLPLSILVALAITNWVTERANFMWEVPAWSVPVHALITLALWLVVGLSLVLLGKRLLVDLPAAVTDSGEVLSKLAKGIYSRETNQPEVVTIQGQPVFAYVLYYIQLRTLITVLVTLLNGVLFFLIGSLWGARTASRGMALGTLSALLLVSAGLGGRAAFDTNGDPREFWHTAPVTDDVNELRDTLTEMSLRDTGEPRLISITAQVSDDGALAWALRDFVNTQFVDGVGPEVETAAVVTPWLAEPPRMGADYVGKDLVTRQVWDVDALSWKDALMWLYRSESAVDPLTQESLMLWVRADVYGVESVE